MIEVINKMINALASCSKESNIEKEIFPQLVIINRNIYQLSRLDMYDSEYGYRPTVEQVALIHKLKKEGNTIDGIARLLYLDTKIVEDNVDSD